MKNYFLKIVLFFICIINLTLFCNENILINELKKFSSEKIEKKIDFEFFNLFIELATMEEKIKKFTSEEKRVSETIKYMELLFFRYLKGKDIKKILSVISNIIYESFSDKKIKNNFGKKNQFKNHLYASISLENDKLEKLVLGSDIHSSYDSFSLFYSFLNNSISGDYLIFSGDYVNKDYADEYGKNWMPLCEGYGSIFNLIVTGVLNAFFISEYQNLKNKFNEKQVPLIIFTRGNHESIQFIKLRGENWLNTLYKNNCLEKNSNWEEIFDEYTKNVYPIEVLFHVENGFTMAIGHSSGLELLENPIDCKNLKKNNCNFSFENLLDLTKNTDDSIKELALKYSCSGVLDAYMINKYLENNENKDLIKIIEGYLNFNKNYYKNLEKNDDDFSIPPFRTLCSPSNNNKLDDTGERMALNPFCSYLIHSFNYLNPANLIENPTFNLRISACGHSHGENTVSLQKALTEGNICILPGNSSFYTEQFEKINFNEEKNKKIFLVKNNSSIYDLIENNSMFALFMQPFIKNGPGKYISEKTIKIGDTNLIYSILYSIFYDLNEYNYEDLNSCLYLVKKDKNNFRISRIFSFFFDKKKTEENFIKKYIL